MQSPIEVKIPLQAYGENALADVKLGERMIFWLEHYYPGHAFFVQSNHEAGTVTIQLLYEDKKKVIKRWAHGMLIHIVNLGSDNDIKRRAMLDGGELLERYQLARKGANPYTRIDAGSKDIITEGAIL